MLDNQKRREILEKAKSTGYEGSVLDLYQAANQGADVSKLLDEEAEAKSKAQTEQRDMQQDQNQAQQLQNQAQSTQPQESIAPPPKLNVDMNPTQMGSQAHLVQSGNPTDVGMAPTGTGAKSAAEISSIPYRDGGYVQKFIEGGYSEEELESLFDEYEQNYLDLDGDTSLSFNDYKKQVQKYGSEIAGHAYYGKSGNTSLPYSYVKSNQNLGFNPYTGSYDKIENLQKQFGQQVPEGYDFNTYDPDMKWMDNAPGMIGEVELTDKATTFDPLAEEKELGTWTSEDLRDFSGAPKYFDTSFMRNRMRSFGQGFQNSQRSDYLNDLLQVSAAGVGVGLAVPTAVTLGGAGAGQFVRTLAQPIQRYGGKGIQNFRNVGLSNTSNIYKTRQFLSGTYNTLKATSVPGMYGTVFDQIGTEIEGEGNLKNRLGTASKLTDLNPALSTIKEGTKITSDLVKGDYTSATLRGLTSLVPGFKKSQFGTGVKYHGTKILNKFLDTKPTEEDAGIVTDAPNLFNKAVKGTANLFQSTKDFFKGPQKMDLVEPKTFAAVNRRGGVRRKDPVVGTGKKPKGSGRRLYTDENPKDTVSIKFATPSDARATVAKVKRINKPYARKIQILTVGEQRAKVMGKTEVARIFKRGKEAIRKARKNV